MARREHGLTRRELEVLRLLVTGQTNKEIATVLSISVATVEVHVSHILRRLSCQTRTQAATFAVSQGWVVV